MKLSSIKLPDMAALGIPSRTLAPREKIMLGATGGLVVLVGLYFLLLAGDGRTTEELVRLRDTKANQLRDQQIILNKAKDDRKRQVDWQKRSLPSNAFLAKAAYEKWLRELAGRSNLHAAKISSTETGSRREQFEKFAFTLKATTSIENIATFMYGFYSVGYLHQIRNFDVKPLQQSHDLEVTIGIEVLALPGAESKDKLPTEPGHGLQLKTLADYSAPIAARNLFAPYTAPKPMVRTPVVDNTKPPVDRPPPAIPTIDPAERTFVTGFTEADGIPQIWLMDRMAGKSLTLQIGETFRVGKASGVVRTIEPEGEAVIEYDGKKRLLHGGDTLRGGVEVKDVGKTTSILDKVGKAKGDRDN